MILDVNSLATFYGDKRRSSFAIDVEDAKEETVKAAIAKRVKIERGLTVKSEDFKIVAERRLVLHNYELTDEKPAVPAEEAPEEKPEA